MITFAFVIPYYLNNCQSTSVILHYCWCGPPHSGFFHIRVLTAYSFLLLSASARSYLTISITHIVSSHLNVFDKSLRLGMLKAGDVFHWNPLQGSRCFPFHVNSPRNALSPLLSVLGCPPHCCQGRWDSLGIPDVSCEACPSVLSVQVTYPYRLVHTWLSP